MHPVGLEQPGRASTQTRHLAAGADQDDVGVLAAVDEDVGPPVRHRSARSAVPSSTGRSWRVRISAVGPSPVDGDPQGLRRLVGVGRPDDPQPGHGPQGGQLLDRLVGRAVLAEADRVVGPEVDDLGLLTARPGGPRPACSR